MGFLDLFALGYLSTAGILVLIYFFRKKRKTIPVSSFIPWRVLRQETLRTRFFMADALFILQLIALTLLTLYLTRPYITSTAKGILGKNIILLVDNSASMQVKEGRSTRLELARAEAMRIVDSMGMGDSMQIISMHSSPEILSEFSSNKDKLKKVIKELHPLDTGTNLEEGLNLCLSILKHVGNAEVHVLTDKDPPQGLDHRISFLRLGKAHENVAITGLDIYQDMFKDYLEREAYVMVRNFSEETKTTLLRAYLNKELLTEEALELPPREERTLQLRGIRGPGLLVAELLPEDPLLVDNRAYAIINPKKTYRILVVTDEPLLMGELGKIEKATEQLKFSTIPSASYRADSLKGYDMGIFHKYVPEEYPQGNALFILPPKENRFFSIAGWTREARVIDWNNLHPILRHLDYMEELWIHKALHLVPQEGLEVLIKAAVPEEDFAVALAGILQARRLVVLGFDITEFNLSKARDIPVLVMLLNVFQWLNPEGSEASQIKTGERFSINLGTDQQPSNLSLLTPRGKKIELEATAGPLVVTETYYAGEYVLEAEGIEKRFVANLFDETESDISLSPPLEKRTEFQEAKVTSFVKEERREIGRYILALVALLLFVEWVLYYVRARTKVA